ncbi:hypothetical protein CDAR_503641 [Caerostris darwini]|uniref:Uncharacterized protein n=1 Tax=Caerostris darwini TaxID=1538125 RepID=A0AAV4NS93_9ARAC|nr:hypothetical protein CDAR_503641 [Caerostris darwini]
MRNIPLNKQILKNIGGSSMNHSGGLIRRERPGVPCSSHCEQLIQFSLPQLCANLVCSRGAILSTHATLPRLQCVACGVAAELGDSMSPVDERRPKRQSHLQNSESFSAKKRLDLEDDNIYLNKLLSINKLISNQGNLKKWLYV